VTSTQESSYFQYFPPSCQMRRASARTHTARAEFDVMVDPTGCSQPHG
jgi:hypothetical protein